MAGKNSKSQNNRIDESIAKRQKTAQYLMAAFAIILIISMLLSAVSKY